MLSALIIRVGRSTAFAGLASFAVGIITARWLGPAGRGDYALFTTTAGIIGTVATMGFYHAAIFHISRKGLSPREAIGSVVLLLLLNGLLLALAALLAPATLPPGFHFLDAPLIRVALIVASLVYVAHESLGGIMMALRHHALYLDQRVIEPLFILVATFSLYAFPCESQTAILLRTGASVVAIVVMVGRIHRRIPAAPLIRLRSFAQEATFGLRNLAQDVIALLNYRVYIFFVAADPAAAGQFSVAVLFSEAVRFVPTAVSTALLPTLASHSGEDAGRLAATTCRHLLAVNLLIVAIFALLKEPIIRVCFGATFLPVAAPALIMLVGTLLRTIYQILGSYFTGIGKQFISIAGAAGGLIVALAAAFVLVPRFGLEGAALAYLLSSIVTSLVIAIGFISTTRTPLPELLVLNNDDLRTLWLRLRRS